MHRRLGRAVMWVILAPVRSFRALCAMISAVRRFLDERRRELAAVCVVTMMAVVGVQLRKHADSADGLYVALDFGQFAEMAFTDSEPEREDETPQEPALAASQPQPVEQLPPEPEPTTQPRPRRQTPVLTISDTTELPADDDSLVARTAVSAATDEPAAELKPVIEQPEAEPVQAFLLGTIEPADEQPR